MVMFLTRLCLKGVAVSASGHSTLCAFEQKITMD